VPAYWKFESTSLQGRVREPSVPLAPEPEVRVVRRLARSHDEPLVPAGLPDPLGAPPFRARVHHHSSGMADLARHHLNFAGMELPRGNDLRALGRMAYCLDAMAVGIQHEGAVIISVIVRPKPWRTIVASPASKRRRVKGIDRSAVGSEEADVCAGNRRPHLGFVGDGEFDTGQPRRGAIIGTTAFAEINDAHEAKGSQNSVVETATTVDIGDTQ
jgi:hypothetical protein